MEQVTCLLTQILFILFFFPAVVLLNTKRVYINLYWDSLSWLRLWCLQMMKQKRLVRWRVRVLSCVLVCTLIFRFAFSSMHSDVCTKVIMESCFLIAPLSVLFFVTVNKKRLFCMSCMQSTGYDVWFYAYVCTRHGFRPRIMAFEHILCQNISN